MATGVRPEGHQRPVVPLSTFAWQDQAACRGQDLNLFFGPDGETAPARERRVAKAKVFCAACPVEGECLDWALQRDRPASRERSGVWGGMGEDERVKWLRHCQRQEQQAVA
jgi:WhiB family redox-sensing transcriptional regulator